MKVLLNETEIRALEGLPWLARCLYAFAIKPRMDLHTKKVGEHTRISWQALAEWVYVEPHPGIAGGQPCKSKVRRNIEWLEKAGLIVTKSQGYQLIFECPLSSSPSFAQNKADTKPAHLADTKPDDLTTENTKLFATATPESQQNENLKADIHHYDLNKKEVFSRNDAWAEWFVQKGFNHKVTYCVKAMLMFEEWCKQSISVDLVENAIQIAHTQLGERPHSPVYYRGYVGSLVRGKQNKSKSEGTHGRTKIKTPSHAERMWQSCAGLFEADGTEESHACH